jgi:hypothetical protein
LEEFDFSSATTRRSTHDQGTIGKAGTIGIMKMNEIVKPRPVNDEK